MLQRLVQTVATSGALAALLVGLSRHWDFWSIVRRTAVSYLVLYCVAAVLVALLRFALLRDETETLYPKRDAEKARGTDGTDAATS